MSPGVGEYQGSMVFVIPPKKAEESSQQIIFEADKTKVPVFCGRFYMD